MKVGFRFIKSLDIKKNTITNEDTRDSSITTISALGRDRDEKTFAIEDYKKLIILSDLKN